MTDLARYCDPEEVTRLTRQMIRVNTVNPPGNEAALARTLQAWAEERGLEAGLHPLAPERANLLVRVPGVGGAPPLLYNGHLDTVPIGEQAWRHDPFEGRVDGDRLYGRGATDMKGALAAMLGAAAALKRAGARLRGDLLVACTAGEEVDSVGARALAAAGTLSPSALLVGEPTDLAIAVAEKGALWLEVTTTGRMAHGSAPQEGLNAILSMARLVDALGREPPAAGEHPLLGRATLNVATIHGGIKTNVVPDRCVLTLDIRTLPGQDHGAIADAVRGRLAEAVRAEPGTTGAVRVVNDMPAVQTPPADRFVACVREVAGGLFGETRPPGGVPYYTDGAVLAPTFRAPLVICGPGEPSQLHQTDEWVRLRRLGEAARLYAEVAAAWLG